MNEPSFTGHTRFIVACITLLAVIATAAGSYLLLKGFQSGELLAQMGSNGLAGLVGFLGGKAMSSIDSKSKLNDSTTTTTTSN